MPCNDCSRTETCPPCVNDSECTCSTKVSPEIPHADGCPAQAGPAKVHTVVVPQNTFHRCTCGHVKAVHTGVGDAVCAHCRCQVFVCDHSACGWKPPEEPEPRCVGCGHTDGEGCGCPPKRTLCGSCDAGLPMECTCPPEECVCDSPEEPPLTPEEEEELPPERGCCGNPNCTCGGSCDCDQVAEGPPCSEVEGCDGNCCAKAPPPPQPDRRPPYAVAYSVQGHLYEVALPGDATVQAVDGALIIRHHLGPVAGIVQVLPVINKESDAPLP